MPQKEPSAAEKAKKKAWRQEYFAKGQAAHDYCMQQLKMKEYTRQQAEEVLRAGLPRLALMNKGRLLKYVQVVPEDVVEWATKAQICLENLVKGREHTKKKDDVYKGKQKRISAYEKKTTEERRVVRQKQQNGETLNEAEQKTAERMMKEAITNANFMDKEVHRSTDQVRAIAIEIATENEAPETVDALVTLLLPFANSANKIWYDKVRSLKDLDRARRQERDRKCAEAGSANVAMRRAETERRNTTEQQARITQYHEKNRDMYFIPTMRTINRDLKVDRSLDVQCDEKAFLAKAFECPCTYCGTTDGPRSLDRLDPVVPYQLDNIVTTCLRCDKSKHCLTASQFIGQAREIAAYSAEGRQPVDGTCTYCGAPEDFTLRIGKDRVQPGLPYSQTENCVPCCGACNVMKNTQSLEDFLRMAKSVALHVAHNSLRQNQVALQNLHQRLLDTGSRPRRRAGRPLMKFVGGRNPADMTVICSKNSRNKLSKRYHTTIACPYLGRIHDTCRVSALDAIRKNRLPCRSCRGQLCDAELEFMQNFPKRERKTAAIHKAQQRLLGPEKRARSVMLE